MSKKDLSYLDYDVFNSHSEFENFVDKLINKLGQTRLYFSLIAISLCLIILNCIIVNHQIKTFHVDHTTFSYDSSLFNKHFFVDSEGNILEYTENKPNSTIPLDDRMIYKGDKFIRKSSHQSSLSYETLKNGSEINPTSYENQIMDQLKDTLIHVNAYKPMFYIMTGILCTLFASFSIVYPEEVWQLKRAFDTYGGEPSDFYINISRLFGCIALVFIILLPYTDLLKGL